MASVVRECSATFVIMPRSCPIISEKARFNDCISSREDVTVTEELVTVQLGSINIALPDPLDEPWREVAKNPSHGLTAAHPNSNWVFTGRSPGKHIHPGYLTQRLTRIFSTRAARLGTRHELTKLAPVAIIAETLGYSPKTIERHATSSAATYARYIAAGRTQPARNQTCQ